MGKHSQFPWDLLKAECLRLVCSQLIQASNSNEGPSSFPGGGRKEEMIEFLRDVETRTLDAAVEKVQSQAQNSPRKSVGTAEQPSTAKRTRADEDTADDEDPDGYNTRYKGFKRVKVREEKGQTPKRTPRKSLNASADEGTPVKRGRGRPRKSIPEGTTAAPAVSDNAEKAGANEGEASTAGANEGETSEAGAKNVEISEPAETKDGELARPRRRKARHRNAGGVGPGRVIPNLPGQSPSPSQQRLQSTLKEIP
ncbi:hypothetical protein BJ912DRAFT_846490 [Pholiota molesta]|nr:hypothetical protein BJ912DRAFT_846490 [Pholiota molesta]